MTGGVIDFNMAPDIGTTITLDQQVYELREWRPATRNDGTPTTLLDWETVCPSCDGLFVLTTGLRAKSINRRCPACVKPFKPVKGKRGRKIQVTVHHA